MKAIFVDGASLFCMGQLVGLPRMSFLSLYNLFTAELGREKRLADIPLIVVSPHMALTLSKPLTGAGFDVVAANSKDGSDDRVIIDRIKRLDAERITELVLVTNDCDYMPVVKFKIKEGLRQVYWVGTKKPDVNNRSSIGRDLSNLLVEPGFNFVELDDHKARLAIPAETRAPEVQMSAAPAAQ